MDEKQQGPVDRDKAAELAELIKRLSATPVLFQRLRLRDLVNSK